jgi:hypothetical protein
MINQLKEEYSTMLLTNIDEQERASVSHAIPEDAQYRQSMVRDEVNSLNLARLHSRLKTDDGIVQDYFNRNNNL